MSNTKFKKGQSGNPSGRPPGSRNKATLLCEEMLQGEAERITRKLIEKAVDGNIHALRMCMERIAPPSKERCVQLDLRPINGPQDLPLVHQDIMTAIAEGTTTPRQGESLSNVLATHARLVEVVELDRRIASLEQSQNDLRALRKEIETYPDGAGRELLQDIKDTDI